MVAFFSWTPCIVALNKTIKQLWCMCLNSKWAKNYKWNALARSNPIKKLISFSLSMCQTYKNDNDQKTLITSFTILFLLTSSFSQAFPSENHTSPQVGNSCCMVMTVLSLFQMRDSQPSYQSIKTMWQFLKKLFPPSKSYATHIFGNNQKLLTFTFPFRGMGKIDLKQT